MIISLVVHLKVEVLTIYINILWVYDQHWCSLDYHYDYHWHCFEYDLVSSLERV